MSKYQLIKKIIINKLLGNNNYDLGLLKKKNPVAKIALQLDK